MSQNFKSSQISGACRPRRPHHAMNARVSRVLFPFFIPAAQGSAAEPGSPKPNASPSPQAMTWANEVMRANPDPQAYLAGVHSRLGNQKQAQQIPEREIAANTNATRAVTLRWQLADVCAKAGDTPKARKALEDAAAAKRTPMEAAVRRRLDRKEGSTK